MPRLIYGVDRRLRDGERILADFRENAPYGCVIVGEVEHEIRHRGRSGWHFLLVGAHGEPVVEYDPLPIVRGGRLRGRWGEVSLRGVPLRPRRWTFRGEPGWRLHGKLTAARGPREAGDGSVATVSSYEVRLDGEPPMRTPEVTLQLALGCWVLVERQSLPAGGGGGGG